MWAPPLARILSVTNIRLGASYAQNTTVYSCLKVVLVGLALPFTIRENYCSWMKASLIYGTICFKAIVGNTLEMLVILRTLMYCVTTRWLFSDTSWKQYSYPIWYDRVPLYHLVSSETGHDVLPMVSIYDRQDDVAFDATWNKCSRSIVLISF